MKALILAISGSFLTAAIVTLALYVGKTTPADRAMHRMKLRNATYNYTGSLLKSWTNGFNTLFGSSKQAAA
jgi:hypothetical protein